MCYEDQRTSCLFQVGTCAWGDLMSARYIITHSYTDKQRGKLTEKVGMTVLVIDRMA